MSNLSFVRDDYCLYLKNGQFDPGEQNNLERMFAGYAQSPKTLAVHFHGGLVDKAAGVRAAESLFQGGYGASAYPMFFIWESGLTSALWNSLPRIFAETIFQMLWERVAQWMLGKIDQQQLLRAAGLRAGEVPLKPASKFAVKGEFKKAQEGKEAFAGKSPDTVPPAGTLQPQEELDFQNWLQADDDFKTEAKKIAEGLKTPAEVAAEAAAASRGAPVEGSTATLMSPEVIAEMRGTFPVDGTARAELGMTALYRLARGAARVLKNVIWRFAQGRDHGIHATIVEELLREFYLGNIGRAVWETMKDDTKSAFGGDEARHGGTAFLHKLKGLWSNGKPPRRTVLVGHSAGAIYLCHFLQHAKATLPPEAKFDVVFLAAACDFKLLDQTLDRCHEQINNVRLFGMSNDLEKAELLLDVDAVQAIPVVKKLYPGSLLYFVSGVLEDEADKPLVGMQRFHSGASPYDGQSYAEIADILAYFRERPHSFLWSKINNGDGLASDSTRHGDFDDDPVTRKSLAHILAQGF